MYEELGVRKKILDDFDRILIAGWQSELITLQCVKNDLNDARVFTPSIDKAIVLKKQHIEQYLKGQPLTDLKEDKK